MKKSPRYTADTWPIAAAMIQFPNILPDGSSVQDQSPEAWAHTLRHISMAGFTELDPTDSWLRVADLSPERLRQFRAVVDEAGLTIPAISTARKSVIDLVHGDENLAYCHRVLDVAAEIGATEVAFGLFGALTEAQKRALWFWTAQGVANPNQPDIYYEACERIRDLGRHAASVGITISLEMYEDTYIGTADGAVRFVQDVDHPAVGINADIGNLIRLHRPVEHWKSMIAKIAPYARYWHVKNYFRDEDAVSGQIATSPAALRYGLINYREAIATVLEHGFDSPFLVEHYGGDGITVCAENRDYVRDLLRVLLPSD